MRDYEILYIVRPELDENEVAEAAKKVEGLIDQLGGSVDKTNLWGKRRLAYDVAHLREGYYVLTDFKLDTDRVPEMEATLKISEQVFRHLVVRKPEPPKPGARRGARPPAAAEVSPTATPTVNEPATAAPADAEAATPAAADTEAAAPAAPESGA